MKAIFGGHMMKRRCLLRHQRKLQVTSPCRVIVTCALHAKTLFKETIGQLTN